MKSYKAGNIHKGPFILHIASTATDLIWKQSRTVAAYDMKIGNWDWIEFK